MMKKKTTPKIKKIKKEDSFVNPVWLYRYLNFLLLAKKSPSIASINTGTTAANANTSAIDTSPVKNNKRFPFLRFGLSNNSLILFIVSIMAFFDEDNLILVFRVY